MLISCAGLRRCLHVVRGFAWVGYSKLQLTVKGMYVSARVLMQLKPWHVHFRQNADEPVTHARREAIACLLFVACQGGGVPCDRAIGARGFSGIAGTLHLPISKRCVSEMLAVGLWFTQLCRVDRHRLEAAVVCARCSGSRLLAARNVRSDWC